MSDDSKSPDAQGAVFFLVISQTRIERDDFQIARCPECNTCSICTKNASLVFPLQYVVLHLLWSRHHFGCLLNRFHKVSSKDSPCANRRSPHGTVGSTETTQPR